MTRDVPTPLVAVTQRREARNGDGGHRGLQEFKSGLLRELTNTAGQLLRLQRENETVRRRMDDVLRCNARLASMLHRQSRMLEEMSDRLDLIGEERKSWFRRWLDRWRQAA